MEDTMPEITHPNIIEDLLTRMKDDKNVAAQLYPALSRTSFWVLVRPGTAEPLAKAAFLAYPSIGSVDELPIFTSQDFPLFTQLKTQSGSEAVLVDGLALFTRLKDVIVEKKTELAINPGWEFGVRLTQPMVISVLAVAQK